jgi:hypothetical protein
MEYFTKASLSLLQAVITFAFALSTLASAAPLLDTGQPDLVED